MFPLQSALQYGHHVDLCRQQFAGERTPSCHAHYKSPSPYSEAKVLIFPNKKLNPWMKYTELLIEKAQANGNLQVNSPLTPGQAFQPKPS